MMDVLFGEYGFSGTLQVTWPNAVSQEPINSGDGKVTMAMASGRTNRGTRGCTGYSVLDDGCHDDPLKQATNVGAT